MFPFVIIQNILGNVGFCTHNLWSCVLSLTHPQWHKRPTRIQLVIICPSILYCLSTIVNYGAIVFSDRKTQFKCSMFWCFNTVHGQVLKINILLLKVQWNDNNWKDFFHLYLNHKNVRDTPTQVHPVELTWNLFLLLCCVSFKTKLIVLLCGKLVVKETKSPLYSII